MLKLHGHLLSINVRKVLWLCEELSLGVKLVERGTPSRPVNDPEFLYKNPFGLVPLLEDGSFALSESNTILRYLVRREGRSDLLPEEAQAAAIIERWIDWQATDFNDSWRYAFVSQIRKVPGYDNPERAIRSQNAFNGKMEVLNDQLVSTSAYVAGSAFSLADIPIGLSVRRWFSMDFEKPHLPEISAYYERLCEREAFIPFGGPNSPA